MEIEKAEEVDYVKVVDAVKRIAATGKKLSLSGLSQRAVVVLLADLTGVSRPIIAKVLAGLNDFERWALVQQKKAQSK